MKINVEKNQPELILKISGRVDTTTSPEMEETINHNLTVEITKLVLDFTEVEYISSAGLRVLLSNHKNMKQKDNIMVVKGANEEVQEVFKITGFSDILNLED